MELLTVITLIIVTTICYMRLLKVPIIDKCYEGMITAVDHVKADEDANMFTER